MKKLQQLFLAAVFTFGLTTFAFAGDIDTGGKTEPPPPPPSRSATISGEIPTGAQNDANSEYRLIEDIALDLFRTILLVF